VGAAAPGELPLATLFYSLFIYSSIVYLRFRPTGKLQVKVR